ncbi:MULTISPECIES: deoxyguanosinetriphosphate triphosphohydrolase [Corynebacterium]|uniref:deoxyguanosinetriphosphate triphosphohydrolase n=1 Tax=Corynebacterium TaxID=1716 RepID=UPI0008A363F5|nr:MULTISPECIES: deoxyguanosinetriphosphate triphosphohydrolase [Corynebacterium]OFO42457.1 deoxyguanosinetriphosphate triphosphohydrolase [Corynebacterium sp. HMSC073D01]QQU89183.1 deoxyguanosinetriphosphate triphosphohydrolase [Corynebacterium glucuronolyticum]
MYTYDAFDQERYVTEAPKRSGLKGTPPDHRSVFSRDRARVLHSAALRRLADKTQVVGPRDGDTPRTRLTHSLEVAQISRGIGEGLGVDGSLAELAGLCHDIGHPPFGHNGEVALNELAADCGGFEGNAQTLRILTRLEPKVMGHGLNLSRASLDAAIKYPWTAQGRRKYGVYEDDLPIFQWVRDGIEGEGKSVEAQIMDASDDIAYSVHDVEDGILAGRIDLRVLGDLVELAALAQKGAAMFGGDPESLVEAAASLRSLPVVAEASLFDGSFSALIALKQMTSELVGRFVGAVITATREHNGDSPLGRHHGTLVVPPGIDAEIRLLKTLAVLYVMESPAHLLRQDIQRERVAMVYEYLYGGAPGTLDPAFAAWFTEADSDAARSRVIIDQIASMTESRLERIAREGAEYNSFYS